MGSSLYHTLNLWPNFVQYVSKENRSTEGCSSKWVSHSVVVGDLVKKRRVRGAHILISSDSKIVKRLRRRQYDQWSSRELKAFELCPSTALSCLYWLFWSVSLWPTRRCGLYNRHCLNPLRGDKARSSYSLIVSQQSFNFSTWARFQMGGAQPVHCGCHFIYWYVICFTNDGFVSIFITSPLSADVFPMPILGGLFIIYEMCVQNRIRADRAMIFVPSDYYSGLLQPSNLNSLKVCEEHSLLWRMSYIWYTIFITLDICVEIFITSRFGWLLFLGLYAEDILHILNVCLFYCTYVAKWKYWSSKPVNHMIPMCRYASQATQPAGWL